MINRLIINASGKAVKKSRMRKNLDYMGIARRAIKDAQINYDREIDISAVVVNEISTSY